MHPESALFNKQIWLNRRCGAVTLVVLGLGLLLPGCGNVVYTYRANGAASTLEAARQAGAEQTALYEYTLASEHLKKAMSEASEADYGDASELARLADEYATLALKMAHLRQSAPRVPAAATLTAEPDLPSAATSGSAPGEEFR